ncbi:MAG: four helix bundle protein [Bacteroidaceae bacterium]|nr:four helix bundle protein [Bacteroidaceae bacterium]
MKENPLLDKSKAFAVRAVRLYVYLTQKSDNKEYILSKQFVRSATSIGANINEGVNGQTKSDFASKMSIALKEAGECCYWIDLLHETEYISDSEYTSIIADCEELKKMLTSIVKTTYEDLGKRGHSEK